MVLSSPSGVGKLRSQKLQQKYQNFKLSVSHTTRLQDPTRLTEDYILFKKKNLMN